MSINRTPWLGSCAIACVAVATPACAQVRSFDIVAQPVESAIRMLGRQGDVQIAASSKVIRGRQASAVRGAMTVDQALDRLLAGTGLTARRTGARTWSVVTMSAVGRERARLAPVAEQSTVAGATAAAFAGDATPRGAANGTGAEDGASDDIVVTAQKRSESIQSVPLSVTAISSRTMLSQGQFHLTDYAATVPGLSIQSAWGVPGNVGLTIRGISSGSTFNTTVATTIDDVPVSSSSTYALGGLLGVDLFPYDIDRIEVLRGPQGTLYGASSLGGLLKYVTPTPDLNRSSIKVGADGFGIGNASELGWGVRATGSVPIIPGELAISLGGYYQKTPGYIDNLATGKNGFNHGIQHGARLAIGWEPTPQTKIKLTALYSHSDFDGNGVILTDATTQKPLFGYTKTSLPQPAGQNNSTKLFSANISHDFGSITLTSLTGYSDARSHLDIDASPLLGPIFGIDSPFTNIVRIKKFSQEVRLSSPEARQLRWRVGMFYTSENALYSQTGRAFLPGTSQPSADFDPLADITRPSRYREISGFGDATYDITQSWDVSAGVRYSRSSQNFTQTGGGLFYGGTLDGQFVPADANAFTYSLGTKYKLAQDAMLYARVATGYRPGGSNFGAAGVPATFDADKLTNYEVGLKSEWFDRRLLFNIAAFYIDWKDIQILESANVVVGYITNAAKARSQGVELSSSYTIAPGLTFGLTGAYTDAELAADAPGLSGLKGDQLPNSSRWTATATANYSRRISDDYTGKVGLVWSYVGPKNMAFPLDPGNRRLKSYNTLQLTGGVENEVWQLNFYIKNLTNKRAYTGFVDPFATILQPRTIGLSVDASF